MISSGTERCFCMCKGGKKKKLGLCERARFFDSSSKMSALEGEDSPPARCRGTRAWTRDSDSDPECLCWAGDARTQARQAWTI